MKERLPPGQRKINRFPTLQAGGIPIHLRKENWTLEIYGEVKNPKLYTYEEFIQLPKTKIQTDIHCVTGWSLFDTEWEGVLFRSIVNIVKPTEKAKFVVFECEDLGGRFTTSLPLIDLMRDETILAFKYNGKDLENKHGGPVRSVVPKKYFYKSAKWVRKLKFTEKDEIGYWEQGGYSNTANPWKEERYAL
ncbi:MAG: molybdopterin-dependent oxidoreductase [Promethearchaeota archaeon]